MVKKILLLLFIFQAWGLSAIETEKSLLILNFEDKVFLFEDKSEILTLLVFSKITDKTNNIQIIDRQELDTLQSEQIIATKNSVKPVREKKFSGSEYILKGKIYSLGDKISINAKLINCKSGKINGISRSYNNTLPIDDILEKFSDDASSYILKKLLPVDKNKKAKK